MPNSLSQQAKELIQSIFVRDPNARPTVEEILENPWIQNL